MTTSSVYRLPGFAAFLAARLLAVFAMQIQAVVVAWQVYDITHDPLSLAYVGKDSNISRLGWRSGRRPLFPVERRNAAVGTGS